VEAAQRAAAVLSEDPESAADRIAAVRKELGSLIEIDARLAPTVELLEKCDTLLREAVFTIGDYSRGLGFDPQRAEQIETRLVEIFKLKQKYGSSCAEILRRGEELEHRLAQYRNEDEHTDELAARIADQKKKLVDRAQALSRRRRRAARKLEEQVNVTLAEVGMKGATWRVRFDPVEFGPIQAPIGDRETPLSENGIEDVEFEIETNPGEGFKPLVRIASGGELSRVMLALKAVGKPARDVSFLVFDEVDSGIGGKVAYAVAGQLKALAQHYQVFLISHLQQMASPADHHFTVVKKKSGNRVTTRIELLDRQGRVEEIARMMATETITDATRRHAEEIIRTPAKR
jgi:DNA repair protein RecN (Recombination protein N)